MTVQANNVTLYFKQTGSGPPLILLHGNGEDHHTFDRLGKRLQSHFTLYAVDSRNHGHSERTQVYSYQTMMDDIYGFLQVLNLGPVHILGFSDGAVVALLLAIQHPKLVRRQALLGVNLHPSDFRERVRQRIQEHWEETGDPLYQMMLEQPNIALSSLASVQTPTLLVRGEKELFRPELYTDMLRALPSASLHIVEGHNHDSYIVGEDLLYPELIAFFTRD